jgi:hypothetical protein
MLERSHQPVATSARHLQHQLDRFFTYCKVDYSGVVSLRHKSGRLRQRPGWLPRRLADKRSWREAVSGAYKGGPRRLGQLVLGR